ncbi:MAG: FHA domain-containing protein [Planctomycetota bacterium]|jgi:pSer/pThr/pTyr-binding forkhead associated (FHA) protein
MNGREAKGTATEPAAERRYVLRIRRPSGHEEILGLSGEAITIGRAHSNTLVLDDAPVSRSHARIDCGGDRYVLTDCGSKNGTFVNGKRIQGHVLMEGDRIHFGETQLIFEAAQAELRVETCTYVETENFAVESQVAHERAGIETLATISDLLKEADAELSVLEQVALQLRSVVACDRATIILVEEGTGNPLMKYSHGGGQEGPDEPVIRAGLTAGRPVSLSVPKASGVLDSTLGVNRHVLLVPLRHEDRKLGLLAFEREPVHAPFDRSELKLASIAGTHLTSFLRGVV